jgi:hypothetical protein
MLTTLFLAWQHTQVLSRHSDLLQAILGVEETNGTRKLPWDCSLPVALAVLRMFYDGVPADNQTLWVLLDGNLLGNIFRMLDLLGADSIAARLNTCIGSSNLTLTIQQAAALAPLTERMNIPELKARCIDCTTQLTSGLPCTMDKSSAEAFTRSLGDSPSLLGVALSTALQLRSSTALNLWTRTLVSNTLPPAVFSWAFPNFATIRDGQRSRFFEVSGLQFAIQLTPHRLRRTLGVGIKLETWLSNYDEDVAFTLR